MRTDIGQVRVGNGAFAIPYQINVYRDHPPASEARLHNLALSGVTLAETFDKGIQSYTATAAPDATETIVTSPRFRRHDGNQAERHVEDADGTVDLKLGENTITVEVTAEDGTTIQTYTVTVTGGYGKLRVRGILCD